MTRLGPGGTWVVRPAAALRPAVPSLVAAALVVMLLATLSGAARGTDGGLLLQVWDHEHQESVHTRQVGAGERFQLQHTHSVTRRPVIETFSVAGPEGVAIEELWFDEFGPNLPAGAERIGEVTTTFTLEDGGFRVLHHGRLLPTVPIRVGRPGVDHVLSFADGSRLRLLDTVRPAAFIEIRVVS